MVMRDTDEEGASQAVGLDALSASSLMPRVESPPHFTAGYPTASEPYASFRVCPSIHSVAMIGGRRVNGWDGRGPALSVR